MHFGLSVRTRVSSSEFIGTRTSALFGELSRDGVGGTIVVSWVCKGKHQGSTRGVHFACG